MNEVKKLKNFFCRRFEKIEKEVEKKISEISIVSERRIKNEKVDFKFVKKVTKYPRYHDVEETSDEWVDFDKEVFANPNQNSFYYSCVEVIMNGDIVGHIPLPFFVKGWEWKKNELFRNIVKSVYIDIYGELEFEDELYKILYKSFLKYHFFIENRKKVIKDILSNEKLKESFENEEYKINGRVLKSSFLKKLLKSIEGGEKKMVKLSIGAVEYRDSYSADGKIILERRRDWSKNNELEWIKGKDDDGDFFDNQPIEEHIGYVIEEIEEKTGLEVIGADNSDNYCTDYISSGWGSDSITSCFRGEIEIESNNKKEIKRKLKEISDENNVVIAI